MRRLKEKLIEITPIIQNYRVISIFRIIHAILCFILVIQYIELVPFTFNTQNEIYILTLRIFHFVWIFNILLILLGTDKRIYYIFHYIFLIFFMCENVGDYMLKMSAFWMIFMIPKGTIFFKKNLKYFGFNDKYIKTPDWSVFLLLINLSFIVFTAGYYKLIGPAWSNGLGFYYAFFQPWIKVDFFTDFLSYEWFVYPMNYLGIIFETLPFFLIFFKKTRPIALFMLFCFLVLVFFPLRIDPVGPAGLSILFLSLSLYLKSNKKINFNFQNNKYYSISFYYSFLLIIINTLLFFNTLIPPYVIYPYKKKNSNYLDKKIEEYNLITPINYLKYGFFKFTTYYYFGIFGYNNSFNRSIYQIENHFEDTMYKPWNIFLDNGRIDPNGKRSGLMKALNLLIIYDPFGVTFHKINRRDYNLNELNEYYTIKQTLKYAEYIHIKKYNDKPDSIILKIKPTLVPYKYEGKKIEVPKEWPLMIYYFPKKDTMFYKINHIDYKFRKIEIDEFKKREILFQN